VIEKGADVNARDSDGNTALLHAPILARGWPRRNGWTLARKRPLK